MDEVAAYIESLDIVVSPELRQRLRDFRRQTYRRGEHVLREGTVANAIAFVAEGQVRHYYLLEGKEYTRWVALPQRLTVAFKSFVRQIPSSANLVCIEPTTLLVMSRLDFLALKEDFEAIRQLWALSLETEMVRYEDRVTQLITKDSTARYLTFLADYPEQARHVPLKYIASMLGIEPRHLSRIRSKLARPTK